MDWVILNFSAYISERVYIRVMNNIAEVVQLLVNMVADCRKNNDPRGYFAALYLQMTQRVQQGIQQGAFQNGPRMEKLDVLFATRYFAAYDGWNNGQSCTNSWKIAFNEAQNDSISVLQHLLCGINAHINLDLGIAASQTAPGEAMHDLKSDFYRINDIIGSLMGDVQSRLGTISWPMRFLDDLAGSNDSKVANFSISMAREAAWLAATDLAGTSNSNLYIQQLDLRTQKLGQKIASPGNLANLVLKPVKWFEKGSVSDKIGVMLG